VQGLQQQKKKYLLPMEWEEYLGSLKKHEYS